MSSAICFILDLSKILSFGNGLNIGQLTCFSATIEHIGICHPCLTISSLTSGFMHFANREYLTDCQLFCITQVHFFQLVLISVMLTNHHKCRLPVVIFLNLAQYGKAHEAVCGDSLHQLFCGICR